MTTNNCPHTTCVSCGCPLTTEEVQAGRDECFACYCHDQDTE